MLEGNLELLRDGLGVVVAPERNVAREDRRAAAHDVRLHDRGADVDEGDGLTTLAGIVHLELIAERETVDVHDRRHEPGVLDDGRVLEHLRLLDRDEDQVEHTVVLTHALKVEEHFVDREGHVMLGLELHDVGDFFGWYFRNLHFLDDQLSAADRDGAVGASHARA